MGKGSVQLSGAGAVLGAGMCTEYPDFCSVGLFMVEMLKYFLFITTDKIAKKETFWFALREKIPCLFRPCYCSNTLLHWFNPFGPKTIKIHGDSLSRSATKVAKATREL